MFAVFVRSGKMLSNSSTFLEINSFALSLICFSAMIWMKGSIPNS